MAVAACGRDPDKDPAQGEAQVEKEDYKARFLARNWNGLGGNFDAKGLIAGLSSYVHDDGPIYPPEDRRFLALHNYLYFAVPNPVGLKPLLGPRKAADDVEDWVLRRDTVAYAVVTSFYRRLDANPEDPYRAALWDALAYAGAHFSFDKVYGDAHTKTGAEIADLFMDPKLSPNEATRAALLAHFDAMIAAWRKRVTEKASTTMFGIFIRHLGAQGADLFFREWKAMSENERYNLLKQTVDMKGVARASRILMVDALVATSIDVREAALEALGSLGAPVADIEIGAPEEELRKDIEPLRRWAAKTDS